MSPTAQPVPSSLLTPRPPSPKKTLVQPSRTATPAPVTPNFDSGFAPIKRFTSIVSKIGLVLYAFIALWFILDAVREAIHTLSVPFRFLTSVGAVVLDALMWVWEWLWNWVVTMWKQWR